jgi:hypothetical protein
MIVPGSASPLLTTTDGAYSIAKSLRFRSSASAYLSRTPGSAGNRKTWTWSGWVKRGAFNAGIFQGHSSGNLTSFAFGGTGNTTLFVQDYTNGSYNLIWETSAVFRDPSAWYHFVIAYDTTQASSANAVKIYVNGVQQTLTFTAANGAYVQNRDSYVNNTNAQNIGTYSGVANYQDGYMADVYLIDGQALTASSFGETDSVTGVWKPKAYSGTYGTNGFYLKFTDVATTSGSNAGLGKDFSGNGNYWTTNNISVTSGATYDSMKDVPTLTDTDTANYAVMNPIDASSGISIVDGNLKVTGLGASVFKQVRATIAARAGKWYFEMTAQSSGNFSVGITKTTNTIQSDWAVSAGAGNTYLYYGYQGYKYNGSSGSSYGSTYTSGDTIGVAFDLDSGSITFYKNGTSQGVAFTWTPDGSYWAPFVEGDSANQTATAILNFGQQSFAYTAPTGHKKLNTYNIPDSNIVAGNKVIDATLWSGDGSSSRSILNSGSFKPDIVWIKTRNATNWNNITDSVRGIPNKLYTNSTSAEDTNPIYGKLSSFNSTGFSVTAGTDATSPISDVNQSGTSYVAWQWKAGQGSTSSNTSGSITSTVSVNASSGFSIVSWTGTGSNATVGHGLGVAPKFIITKNKAVGTTDWVVYHASLGGTKYIRLNLTNALSTSAIAWNNTDPTSSVFSVGTWDSANGSGNGMISYCWAEIPGFSSMGTFSSNLSADGSFIYTGFRPKFFLMKPINSADRWFILDSSRNSYNFVDKELYPNSQDSEGTGGSTYSSDFVSNGIKIRNQGIDGTWLYVAFAENPFKNSLAR